MGTEALARWLEFRRLSTDVASSQFDGVAFDPFSFQKNGLAVFSAQRTQMSRIYPRGMSGNPIKCGEDQLCHSAPRSDDLCGTYRSLPQTTIVLAKARNNLVGELYS
jgi:hypothetical protein